MTGPGWGVRDDSEERDRLIGVDHLWLNGCRAAIASPDEFAALWESLSEGEPTFEALQHNSNVDWLSPRNENGEAVSGPLPPPQYVDLDDRPTPLMESARTMLELAEVLAGRRDAKDTLARALRHYDFCGVHCVGNYLLGSTTSLTSGDGPLPDLISQLLGAGSHPSRGFVMMLLGALADRVPKDKQHSEVPVLFVVTDHRRKRYGSSGHLRLRLLEDGPSGIHPDVSMAFLVADLDLNEGIDAAWGASGLAATGSCVLWSVVDADGNPCNSLEGDSMSAAFAVALDDLGPRKLFHRLRRVRSLDPTSVVTAGLSGKTLTRVEGYKEKLAVASDRQWRVVVAKSAITEAHESAPTGFIAKVIPANTVDDAISQTRTEINRVLVAFVATIVVVVALAVPAGLFAYSKTQQSYKAEVASELASASRDKANQDSRLAALLALAGDKIHSSEITRSAMHTVADNNKSVIASAKAGTNPITHLASYGDLVLTNASDDDVIKVWSLHDMAPLGDIHSQSSVRGIAGGGYSMTGMFAVLDGTNLNIFQGIDGAVPALAASFATGFDDPADNVFGPIINPDTNAVVVFDENYRGVFWAPGMEKPDRFNLKTNSANSTSDGDFHNETVVALGNFGKLSAEEASAQQISDTGGNTVTIAGSDNSLRQLLIDLPPGTNPNTGGQRIYSTDRIYSDVGSPIHAVSLTPSGTVRVGTNKGLQDFFLDADDTDVEGLIREQITKFAYIGMSSDEFAAVTSKGLQYIDEGRVAQSLTNTSADAAVDRAVHSIAPTSNGTILTGRADGSVFVHDPANSMTRLKPRYGATDVKFSPAGHLIMGGVDGAGSNSFGSLQVQNVSPVLDAQSKRPSIYGWITDYSTDDYHSYSLGDMNAQVFSVDATDTFAAAAGYSQGDRTARVWLWDRSQASDDQDFRALSFPGRHLSGMDTATSVALSPDGRRVYGLSGSRGQVVAWDTASGDVVWARDVSVANHEDAAVRVAMTFDADRKVGLIKHWSQDGDHGFQSRIDLDSGDIQQLPQLNDVDNTDISPDGTKVAAARENDLAIYSIDGTKLAGPVNLGSTVGAVAWSADSRRLAVDIFGSGQISFRSADRLDEVAPIWRITGLSDTDQVADLAWSPDGQYLAANTVTRQRDNYVRTKGVEILLTTNLDLTQAMCSIASSDLTTEEWERYVGDGIDQFPLCLQETR